MTKGGLDHALPRQQVERAPVDGRADEGVPLDCFRGERFDFHGLVLAVAQQHGDDPLRRLAVPELRKLTGGPVAAPHVLPPGVDRGGLHSDQPVGAPLDGAGPLGVRPQCETGDAEPSSPPGCRPSR